MRLKESPLTARATSPSHSHNVGVPSLRRAYGVLTHQITVVELAKALHETPTSPWAGATMKSEEQAPNPRQRLVRLRTPQSPATVALCGDDDAQSLYVLVRGARSRRGSVARVRARVSGAHRHP